MRRCVAEPRPDERCRHCEWTNVKSETGLDIVVEELRFFDHWLKDVNNCVMHEPGVYGDATHASSITLPIVE